MGIPCYLAMTAAEFSVCSSVPERIAWMACHFSPYGNGLSNLPAHLPPDSLIILNDQTPISRHDPAQILQQLSELCRKLQPAGILMDLQRPGQEEAAALAEYLCGALPCPVCVSDLYAAPLDCPVFLSPVPPDQPIAKYIAPWRGREIWLDIACSFLHLHITGNGCRILENVQENFASFPMYDPELFCHYGIFTDDSVHFCLKRTADDLRGLLQDGARFGITKGVGLWQDFSEMPL